MTRTDRLDLRGLIQFVSKSSEMIFYRQGCLRPMFHAITADGRDLLFEPPVTEGVGTALTKDIGTAMARAAFELNNVIRYVFFDEAWILDTVGRPMPTQAEIARIHREGLANHPDRREVVMFSGEDHESGLVTAHRYILRPEHGKARLMPLEFEDRAKVSTGRLVGLLPRQQGQRMQ